MNLSSKLNKRVAVTAAIVSIGGAASALGPFIPAAQATQEWYCYQPISGKHQYIYDKKTERNLTTDGWVCTQISK